MRPLLLALLVFFSCTMCVESAFSYENGFDPRCSGRTHLGGRRCSANDIRYRYSRNKGDCEVFTYGGCRSGANSFKTLNECRKACVKPKYYSTS